MFVKLSNGQPIKFPYTLGELRRDNSETSFPETVDNDTLATYDVYTVIETVSPTVDSKTHRVTQWVEHIDTEWIQTWQVQKLSEERAAENIRAVRKQLLSDCDWTQLPDAPVDAASWASYRQQLRDITAQVGFPWDVIWPIAPG